MILQQDHWHFGYEQIVNDCRVGDDGVPKTALLLCNADVDAMACARILSFMLRSDGVNYQLLPCTNYAALEKNLSSVQIEDIRAVVLLNFGAARNLTRLFDGHSVHRSTKVYVMDCRKPVHLANIYAGDNIVIFMDAVQGEGELPSDGDNLSGNEQSSSSEDDDGDSDDSDDDSDDSGIDPSDDEGDDEEEEEASFDDVVDVSESRQGNNNNKKKKGNDKQEDPAYDGEDEIGDDDDHESQQRERDDLDDGDEPSEQSPKRRKTDHSDTGHDGSTDVEQQSDEDSGAGGGGTGGNDGPLDPREIHRKRRERLESYYTTGSFFGSPAAFIAYRLAMQLRFGDQSDLLWLACVGVTDAYLHARLDLSGYTALTFELRRLCLRLFPDDQYERVANTVYAEQLWGGPRVDGQQQDRTKITFCDNGRIISNPDYRFFLLRHSSLFESMVQSDYISTKLQVWNKRGMQRLQELLAKMGYPLDECKQPFAFMKPSLRRRLQEKIAENSQDYNLGNFQFTSFFRVTGYQSLLSAADTSYAVTALLECDTPETIAADSDGNLDEDKMIVESFNIAYDALNSNMAPVVGLNGLTSEGRDTSSLINGGNLSGNTGIGAGIRLAMKLQNSIISTAKGLVERNAISCLRHFRYAYLTCTSAGENQTGGADLIRSNSSGDDEQKYHIFSKPLALSRLAHYLMDMHRETGKWTGSKARPLVLMAEKPQTKSYLVVGYEYPERSGNFVRNKFGKKFEWTAQSMNGTFKFDSFDSNVVEISANDVQRFIEQLHYIMDSS